MLFLERKKHGIVLFLQMNYLSKMIFILKASNLKRNNQIIMIAFGLFSAYSTQNDFVFAAFLGIGLLMILHEYERPRWISLEFRGNKHWTLNNHREGTLRATLLPSGIVFRYLMILPFEEIDSRRKKMVVIFSDQLEKEHYRALRRCVINA